MAQKNRPTEFPSCSVGRAICPVTPFNDFTGRAKNSASPVTAERERASGKALPFTGTLDTSSVRPGCTFEVVSRRVK
jgi:hypothetical protein